jgi:uncharacterized membrane protein
MNQLIVVAFDHLEDARKAMKRLRELESHDKIHFEDTAIIEREPDGTAHVRNEVSGTTETGAAIGALVGGAIGFAFPPAGIAVGAALGAAVGALMKTGVEQEFVEDVKRTLQPGRSAIFLVIKEADLDAAVASLRGLQGEVIQTTLPTDAEESLRTALR